MRVKRYNGVNRKINQRVSLQIITTHLHADFDCIASMMAAKKLYPDAILLFPGSQEKNVRDYLADTDIDFPYRRLKGFRMEKVEQVIVVDACTRERIGPFAKLAERGDVTFHLYDHHCSADIDIPYEKAVIEKRGATVTIMVEILRSEGIDVTPAEATLLALGLYEDTGSLTFTSVCPHDYEAAAWLLGKGANLNVVADYMHRELNPAQIETLDNLLKNIEYETISGISVAVASASADRYVGDVASLAHKVMDIESASVLFVMVRMEDRVQVVARSVVEAFDAGSAAARLGGGGHPTAASATIKEMTLPQATERVWEIIHEIIEPLPVTGDIMLQHVITTPANSVISDSESLMTRYDINAMPVTDDGKVVGLITRQVVEKAIHHKMENQKVTEFMTSEFAIAHIGTPAKALEEIILGRKQKQVPVVDKESGQLVGLVTRGMALAKLYGDSLNSAPGALLHGKPRRAPMSRDLSGRVRDRLPKKTIDLLNIIREVADEAGYTAYAVGGFVRDILLRIPNNDIDVVIEGDGIDFAAKLTSRLDGRMRPHKKFNTAVVILKDGQRVDVATARMEYYAHPAALPTVQMSAIRNDLYRRDFSINAMAVRLNGKKPNTLLDFFGGQADVKDHAIRILHNLSFVEDPTRAFRAVRFEARYGFSMGKQTMALLKSAIKAKLFHHLSDSRLFAELKLILGERRPARAIHRLNELGLLNLIHKDLSFGEGEESLMERCEDMLTWINLAFPEERINGWETPFMALLSGLDGQVVDEIARRFHASARSFGNVMQTRRLIVKTITSIERNRAISNSELYKLLSPFSVEGILYFAAKSNRQEVNQAVTGYLSHQRFEKPLINGNDLIKMGLEPGREIKTILEKTFANQLDGEVLTRKDALELAEKMVVDSLQ